jgi:TRAP-type mannitol/chloroaromatic compound transport system permease small subunit
MAIDMLEDAMKHRFIDRISIFVGEWAGLLVIAAVLVTVWEIVSRYVFNSPTMWAHVTTTSLTGVTYLVAGAYVLQRGELIRMTFLVERAEPRLRRWLDLLSDATAIFWGIVLVWGSSIQAEKSALNFRNGEWKPETTGGAWDVPIPTAIRVLFFLGVTLFLLQAIVIFYRRVRVILNIDPATTPITGVDYSEHLEAAALAQDLRD